MSANSSNKQTPGLKESRFKRFPRIEKTILFCLLIVLGFGAARALVVAGLLLLKLAGVSFAAMNESVFSSVVSVIIYALTLLIVIGLPWWVRNYQTTKKDIGLTRLLTWSDLGLAPAGFIIYFLATAIVSFGVSKLIPGIDLSQAQQTGFDHLSRYYEYVLAFVTLIVLAPIAEEVLFRGYLYGRLRRILPLWLAILITSALFGFVHGQWNVGIDVFILSIVLCCLREVTGNIWAGILLHMMKNGLAFYLLFINPDILRTIGG